MQQSLSVWAERFEGFVLVGKLSLLADGSEVFAYDESYVEGKRAEPIYPILPLR